MSDESEARDGERGFFVLGHVGLRCEFRVRVCQCHEWRLRRAGEGPAGKSSYV